MPNLRYANRDQPFLLPPDMRDWVPENDLSHFIVDACERVSIGAFKVNHRGTGSRQYEPRMMLALLVYAYANGVFSSRRIENLTNWDARFRFVSGNLHPDHDTICKFRSVNEAAFAEAFLDVLMMARELKLLKVGTISLDGSKIDANASRYKSVRYDRAQELREELRRDIAQLIEAAEAADASGEASQGLPEELARRESRLAQLDEACARLEKQAKAWAERERAEYERRLEAHESRGSRRPPPKPPGATPAPEAQTNLTDPDSGLMRKSRQSEYRQAYNVQAAVDADGSQLIPTAGIGQSASDAKELVRMTRAVPEELGKIGTVLADAGYANGGEVRALEEEGVEALVAVTPEGGRRQYDFRPRREARPPPRTEAEWRRGMREKLSSDENRAKYRKRKQTVEPVFGIVKEAMGFRRFRLRGLDKVRTEWLLVALAYNCRRLHNLASAPA